MKARPFMYNQSNLTKVTRKVIGTRFKKEDLLHHAAIIFIKSH